MNAFVGMNGILQIVENILDHSTKYDKEQGIEVKEIDDDLVSIIFVRRGSCWCRNIPTEMQSVFDHLSFGIPTEQCCRAILSRKDRLVKISGICFPYRYEYVFS